MKNTLTIRHDTREIVMDRTFAKYAQNVEYSVKYSPVALWLIER